MTNQNIVILGALIGAVGSISYLIDTIKGKVKPNRVSFILWALPSLIAFAAALKDGGGIETLMTFSVGFFPLLIFFASFVNKKSVWKLSTFDLTCGALSLVGLVLWLITKEGNLAVLFSIISDGLASIPTVIKAYKHPETESAWPWMAPVVGIVMTLYTLPNWTFINSAFIIYVLMVNTLIYVLVQFKIGKRKK